MDGLVPVINGRFFLYAVIMAELGVCKRTLG